MFEADPREVLPERKACGSFEEPGQVVKTQVDVFGDVDQRDWVTRVRADIIPGHNDAKRFRAHRTHRRPFMYQRQLVYENL